MPALDTNILVRWLTNDDAAQCAAVARLLDQARATAVTLFVPVTVVLELEWVLRSRYRFEPGAVQLALNALLDAPELTLESEKAVEEALWRFKQPGSPDFADCLHISLARQSQQTPFWTLDARAARATDVQLLT